MTARLLAAWVNLARRGRWAVLLLCLLLTALAVWAAATRLGVSTDTSAMLDPELAFQRQDRALKEAFPQLGGELVVVVEAVTAAQADRATARLTEALRARDDLFAQVSDVAGAPFFRRNGLLYLSVDDLYALSDRLAAAQPVLGALAGDPSLRGLAAMMESTADAVETGAAGDLAEALAPLLGRMAEVGRAALDRPEAPVRLDWRALLHPNGAEDADGVARHLLLAKPRRDFAALSPAGDAMRAIRQTALTLGLTPEAGVTVRLTGAAAMETEELRSVQTGMDMAGALTLAAVLTLLVVGLRSGRLILATVLTLAVGLAWTAGLAALAVGTLNMISVAFAVLFIGLSVDFGIHFALRYKEARDGGADGDMALDQAARGVGPALVLCAVAAAIAFLSFLPTDYLGLAELGLISGLGMAVALVANLTLLPALLALMPPGAARTARTGRTGGGGLGRLSARAEALLRRHARVVAFGALGVGLVGAVAASGVRFDFDPLNLRDPDTESVATLFDLLDDPRISPYAIDILAPDLAAAESVAARVAALPEVARATTARDLVPADQDEKLAVIGDMALFLGPALAASPRPAPDAAARAEARARLMAALDRLAALPKSGDESGDETRAQAARLRAVLDDADDTADLARLAEALTADLPALLDRLRHSLEAGPVALDDLPEALRGLYLTPDGRARVEVVPAIDPRDPNELARFVDAVRALEPSAAGSPVLIRESGRVVLQAFAEAGALALLGIVALLALTLRRLRDILLVFAPLSLAAVLTMAVSALAGLAFNFANLIVLPLLFGLGVASAIHLVQRERGAGDVAEAMASSTPRAVVLSALTTIGSFGSIAASSHPGTASMGVLLTLAIGLAMVCTLVLLPALLALWPSRRP
jgi:hopanoid biosynthesis associated RND transporter like protein HpnN